MFRYELQVLGNCDNLGTFSSFDFYGPPDITLPSLPGLGQSAGGSV